MKLYDILPVMDFDNLIKDPKIQVTAAIIILILFGIGGYFFYKNQTSQINPNDPQAAQQEVKKLVEEVGKLIDLPIGEDPTVATVTDVEKLKTQAFFQKAKNGDKVLIYSNAKKAILYDPQAKRIIDVAPINIGSPSAQQASPSASPK